MARIRPLTSDEAPARSRDLLPDIIERRGSVGAMTMAHSPALLDRHLRLSRAMKRVKLPRPLSEKISIALRNGSAATAAWRAHRRRPEDRPVPRVREKPAKA